MPNFTQQSAPTHAVSDTPLMSLFMSPVGSSLSMMLGFGLMVYGLLIRPQKQKQAQKNTLLKQLKIKDEVAISQGIVGIIQHIDPHWVVLKIAHNTVIQVQKTAIAKLLPPGTFTEHKL